MNYIYYDLKKSYIVIFIHPYTHCTYTQQIQTHLNNHLHITHIVYTHQTYIQTTYTTNIYTA